MAGHLAFMDPPVADFADPKLVRIVELEHACRAQQVGEEWPLPATSPPRAKEVLLCGDRRLVEEASLWTVFAVRRPGAPAALALCTEQR